ncbi:hypothetical protein [Senegalia massiliensis]|uniref:Uncharacterized protein n=1 Tax=Senegalia massiliensis TaxID=1720316 RepID=A0A845R3J2_9CLOT|nr:hypothetical protein [Senegalia massiliensis]NBI08246.1 hypothetical protein [Senegalia massiliensis]
MFEVDGKHYELKYKIKTIEQIETVLKESLVATMRKTEGILSISTLKVCFGFALFNSEGNKVSPQQGMEIAERLIEEDYMKLNQAVVTTIDRDCPFLFQAN